jgi:hypothetical protein
MALTDQLKALFRDIANKLKGYERRTFMGQVVKLLVSAHKFWARPVRQKAEPCVLASTGPSRY